MSRSNSRTVVTTALGVMAIGMLLPARANAIPALARKYKTSCNTCHSMTPRLNSFGEAVMLNGFRWPTADAERRRDVEEELVKEEPVELGTEAQQKAWPDAVWPSTLPGGIPLGIRNRTFARGIMGKGDALDALAWEWELFFLAAMGDNFSTFGHFNIEGFLEPFDGELGRDGPQDKEKVKAKVIGLLNIENLGKVFGKAQEDLLNLQLGIVGVEEADLWNYRSHSTYRIQTTRSFFNTAVVPYPTDFLEKDEYRPRRGPGAMLYGFTPRLRYSAGYIWGMQEGGGTDMGSAFVSAMVKLGGVDNYGRTQDEYAHPHQEKSLDLAMFGSLGSAMVQQKADDPKTTDMNEATPRSTDEFWRAGAGLRGRLKDLTLHVGAMFGAHNNPYGSLNPDEATLMAWYAAPEYYIFPWLMVAARYEEETITVPEAIGLGNRRRARVVPTLHVLPIPNLRFTVEANIFTRKREDSKGTPLDDNSITGSFDFTM